MGEEWSDSSRFHHEDVVGCCRLSLLEVVSEFSHVGFFEHRLRRLTHTANARWEADDHVSETITWKNVTGAGHPSARAKCPGGETRCEFTDIR